MPKASKNKQNILVSNGGTIQINKQNTQHSLEKKYATTANEDLRRKTGSFNRHTNSSQPSIVANSREQVRQDT